MEKGMKKFILFNSPIFWDATKEKEQYLSPLGLGYIATYLEKAGIDVTIVDCVKERKSVNDIVDFINKTHIYVYRRKRIDEYINEVERIIKRLL